MSTKQTTATFLTPPRPRGSDTDNEVTAFPSGSNNLTPHQHVLACLAESGLIWDPFGKGLPVCLAASIPIQMQEWGLPRPTFRHFDNRYPVTIWQLASHPCTANGAGRFMVATAVLGQVSSRSWEIIVWKIFTSQTVPSYGRKKQLSYYTSKLELTSVDRWNRKRWLKKDINYKYTLIAPLLCP